MRPSGSSTPIILAYPYGIATMPQISVRLPDREKEHLSKYCQITDRNQNDVLRELIRRLSIKGALNPLD